MGRSTVRAVHISDVHLGAGAPGSPADARHRRGLSDAVDLVHALDAHLLLIVGDFFDSNRVSDEVVAFAAAELRRAAVPVLILPGNHDALGQGSVYQRPAFLDGPANVHVLRHATGERVDLGGLDLAVWGRPHHLDAHDFRPLADLPPRTSHRWQVALAHGHLVRDRHDLSRSWLIHPDEVAASGRDYVALGHWDVACRLLAGETLACYSGSPVTPSWSTQRLSGCALLITLDAAAGVQVRAYRLPDAALHEDLPAVDLDPSLEPHELT